MKNKEMNRTKNFRSIYLTAILILGILITACQKEDFNTNSSNDLQLKSSKAVKKTDKSIAMTAIDAGFSELVTALSYVDDSLNTGLVNLFMNGTDQYTVFAPTNDAFQNLYSKLGATDITDLPPSLVLDVLLYHVTDGRRAANSVVPKNGNRTIETLLGSSFMVYPDLSIEAVGNMATIVTPNISASNGIIHIINEVILPISVE